MVEEKTLENKNSLKKERKERKSEKASDRLMM
jgi:hypothetical protein